MRARVAADVAATKAAAEAAAAAAALASAEDDHAAACRRLGWRPGSGGGNAAGDRSATGGAAGESSGEDAGCGDVEVTPLAVRVAASKLGVARRSAAAAGAAAGGAAAGAAAADEAVRAALARVRGDCVCGAGGNVRAAPLSAPLLCAELPATPHLLPMRWSASVCAPRAGCVRLCRGAAAHAGRPAACRSPGDGVHRRRRAAPPTGARVAV